MAVKPSYIGVLNAVANGERGGYELFKAWSGSTKNKALKSALKLVAVRELEHSVAFEKRLNELGFNLRESSDVEASKVLAKQIKLLDSKASDLKKFAVIGIGERSNKQDKAQNKRTKQAKRVKPRGKQDNKTAKKKPSADPLLNILADPTIDPQTGALIGRFICEERDSARILRAAYKKLAKSSEKK